MKIDGHDYYLFAGAKAEDGSLMLPASPANRGAALYLNIIWVHRAWKAGWLELSDGSEISVVYLNGISHTYKVIGSVKLPYGKYPESQTTYQIATCYSGEQGEWAGLELFQLKLVRVFHPRLPHHR